MRGQPGRLAVVVACIILAVAWTAPPRATAASVDSLVIGVIERVAGGLLRILGVGGRLVVVSLLPGTRIIERQILEAAETGLAVLGPADLVPGMRVLVRGTRGRDDVVYAAAVAVARALQSPGSAPAQRPSPPQLPGTRPQGPGQSARPPRDVPYTGLIVLARGIGARASMSPRLVTRSGDVIYGRWQPGEVDLDAAVRQGVAGFPRNVSVSRRGGAEPLVVRAIGVLGPAGTDIVISDADAALIREANRRAGFLERFLVDIVLE